MLQIVRTLKAKTSARIALASLPVLGEDLDSVANQCIREYNARLKEIASQEHTSYLPVYERQEVYLRAIQQRPGRGFEDGVKLSLQLLVRHFLLRQSFDAISGQNGFVLLTDGMHLEQPWCGLHCGRGRGFSAVARVIGDRRKEQHVGVRPTQRQPNHSLQPTPNRAAVEHAQLAWWVTGRQSFVARG
jgi:hypothetical protein